MDFILYHLAKAILGLIGSLPIRWVARLGRCAGALAYGLDRRHRRVALRNLTLCFGGEKTPESLRALAFENFKRIGENFACAIKTSGFSKTEVPHVLELVGEEKIAFLRTQQSVPRLVCAIGHFGNFELFARAREMAAGYRFATTYRGLRQPALDRLLQERREKSGCLFFERRHQARELMNELKRGDLILGLFSDQHAGDKGLRIPFLGHDCSTSSAPAVFALRYECPLLTVICYRTSLARWRIEVGDAIPTHQNGKPRTPAEIMLDVNHAFEAAVRRDPANWFWVHNRWKPGKWRHTPHDPVETGTPARTAGAA